MQSVSLAGDDGMMDKVDVGRRWRSSKRSSGEYVLQYSVGGFRVAIICYMSHVTGQYDRNLT